jgi:AcrR family transcriptional regulator
LRNTKDDIINSAIELFSIKGYTETSARDIAKMVGIKESSLYNHFSAKLDILNLIIAEYEDFTINHAWTEFSSEQFSAMSGSLEERVVSFMMTDFPKGKEERLLKMLYIILHEQYRNESARRFVADVFIKGAQANVEIFAESLVSAGFIEPFNDKIVSTLLIAILYFFSSCHNLGIVETSPGYDGLTMIDTIKLMYATFLKPTKNFEQNLKGKELDI